ncbi:thioredoxin-domain-containing protein [Mucor ambiguus]|uniref:Thioredoxin-domain-containing protein n=1 Tax=Mucor ambiguus TaxID=91626 RepID=A0A0C9N006_9FUNG|nr:thioredoxin-domain-containing protein [Mucor ambiguus]
MKLFSIANTLLLGYLVNFVHAKSIELNADNINSVISSAPDWKKLSEDLDYLAEESNFHFGTIDCSTQGDLCDEHDIMGYPTVQLWENGDKVEQYKGANKYDPLTEYIKQRIASASDAKLEQQVVDEEEDEIVPPEIEQAEEEEEEEEAEDEADGEQAEIEQDTDSGVLPNPGGISANLDGEQMKEIASNNVPWFIKFYAPWCPHCKSLAPTWTEMASQLRGQINVGEVNCEALPTVCETYEIRGFPTLKMFGQDGEPVQYTSDRSLVSLMKFANTHAGPSVKELDANELEQHLSVKDVALIYLHSTKETDIPELVQKIAGQFTSTIPFYATQDEESFKKFNLAPSDLPAILIAKDNTFRIYPSHDFVNTKASREALVGWIEKEQYPLVSKLGPSNQQSILQGNKPVVINIVNAKDTVSQSKFRNIANVWSKSLKADQIKVIFAEMDRAMWKDYVHDKFNIQHDETAKIVIFDAPNYIYFTRDVNNEVLSLDKPEGLYVGLKNLEKLQGESTLLAHQKVGVSISRSMDWIFAHWLISCLGFGLVGSFVYRYLTFRNPKRLGGSVLPSFRPADAYTHKD